MTARLIDVSDLKLGDLLAALHNAATVLPGVAAALKRVRRPDYAKLMLPEEARQLLEHRKVFTHLGGRRLNIDLSELAFNPTAYNEANGAGLASTVVEQLRWERDVANGVTAAPRVLRVILSDWQRANWTLDGKAPHRGNQVLMELTATDGRRTVRRIGLGRAPRLPDWYWITFAHANGADIGTGDPINQAVGNVINSEKGRQQITSFLAVGTLPQQLRYTYALPRFGIRQVEATLGYVRTRDGSIMLMPDRLQIDLLLDAAAGYPVRVPLHVDTGEIIKFWSDYHPGFGPADSRWYYAREARLDGEKPSQVMRHGGRQRVAELVADIVLGYQDPEAA